MNKKE